MENIFNWEEEDFGWSDENELVTRYENMLKNRQSAFFSVDDYEELYFYYVHFYADFFFLQMDQIVKGGAVIKAAIAQYPDSEILQLLHSFHVYKEKRLSKKMLITQLERIPYPHYEQEHFTNLLAHIYRQIGERNKALNLFISLLENNYSQEDKLLLYYEIISLYETAKEAPLVLKYCNHILETGTVSHEILCAELYECMWLKPIAIPVFELLTQKYTFSMYAWLYLGKSYADILMLDESARAFRYAVAISNNNPFPLVALGRVLVISDKITEAFECFEEAIQLDPKQVVLYVEMGEILYGLDDKERAMYFFSQALDANEKDVNALMGMALTLSSLERYNDSIAYIMRAKKIEELSLEAWLLLADNYIEVDRDGEAEEIYQRLAKKYPKDVDVWLSYSNYYAMIEDFQQAYAVAKQGLAILPDEPHLLYRIANYCFLGQDVAQGLLYLQLAYRINADLAEFFIDYDEEVLKIVEVAEIMNGLNHKIN